MRPHGHVARTHMGWQRHVDRRDLLAVFAAALQRQAHGIWMWHIAIERRHDGGLQLGSPVASQQTHQGGRDGAEIGTPLSGAMNFLQWEAIRLFQQLGVKRYDFVGVRIAPKKGSKQEGLKMFKERFGGRLEQGYMWKYALRPLPYHLYCLAARLRSGGDIVDQEQHKLGKHSPSEAAPALIAKTGSPGSNVAGS